MSIKAGVASYWKEITEEAGVFSKSHETLGRLYRVYGKTAVDRELQVHIDRERAAKERADRKVVEEFYKRYGGAGHGN